MKFPTTTTYIKNNYRTIIKIGYCEAQTLLAFRSPVAYHAGVHGWNCDYYDINGTCICTGYRPHGTIQPPQELTSRYEQMALRAYQHPWEGYAERRAKIEKLLQDYILECKRIRFEQEKTK